MYDTGQIIADLLERKAENRFYNVQMAHRGFKTPRFDFWSGCALCVRFRPSPIDEGLTHRRLGPYSI